MTKFGKALRKKYPTPWAACVALGIDPQLLRDEIVVGDTAAILKGERHMSKRDHKARAKRATEDIDRNDAKEALQRWCDDNLEPSQVDEIGDLIAVAYGGDDDDEHDDGAMTDAYRRRGRDTERVDLDRDDNDEDGIPANRRRRGATKDNPAPFYGRPEPGGRLTGMDAFSIDGRPLYQRTYERSMAADREIIRRDRGRALGAQLCPGIERIRCL